MNDPLQARQGDEGRPWLRGPRRRLPRLPRRSGAAPRGISDLAVPGQRRGPRRELPGMGPDVAQLEVADHPRRHAEVLGSATSSDAGHSAAPDSEGKGAANAMQWALEDAGCLPEKVDYINAHGTGTVVNDVMETKAIKRVFGDRAYQIPISSTKSMIGHCMGGSGALEAIACVKSLEDGVVHPTINLETPDPECDLDYVPQKARQTNLGVVLSNSFGFGGQNACLVLGEYAG